ncbi:DUF1697 domain-containing protein [Odoribacter sp. OttesenSCG-928-L07]|nr:DUF1697 domain-containing protein [Odoribacter sp. OttesenSCG-928-L07]MDL2238715.1 DUF1697 domain-containing protein [Bacteroidales bacterium OttesenSCG-928-L14]
MNEIKNYIAFLKGINVGGKNIIKMADLRQYLSGNGLKNIRTFIQSGNILFESEKIKEVIQKEIEENIYKHYGFHVPVIIRTFQEFEQIVSQCPYSKTEIEIAEADKEVEVFYVALFNDSPSEEEIKKLSNVMSENESFKIINNNMYMRFTDSMRFSKLAATLQKINTTNTVRNWKTINKLLSLTK